MSLLTRPEAMSHPPVPSLAGFDHLHWWVGNARHAAQFFASAFGFQIEGYAGPETGWRECQSYRLRQGQLVFVVTSPLDPWTDVASHVARHGDGVREIAYRVDDPDEAWERAMRRGGVPAGNHRIRGPGDTVLAFVRGVEAGTLPEGYEPVAVAVPGPPVGLHDWDHVVTNVERGALDEWVCWFVSVLGFAERQHFSEAAISTEYSALRSTVVSQGPVVQPINEPAPGRRKSQIEEFLDYYGGPGVQHVAMRTDDIVATVSALRDRGVRFLRVPDTYYDEARTRLGSLGDGLPWDRLAALQILVDRDRGGRLLQIFTEPVASRPTVFLEVIQRDGAEGFGEGNFKALFVSIEAEQARRGNL